MTRPRDPTSEIREGIVNIMSLQGRHRVYAGYGTLVGCAAGPASQPRARRHGEARAGDARVSSNAVVCIFWCTVAIGGLLQGRSENLVSRKVATPDSWSV